MIDVEILEMPKLMTVKKFKNEKIEGGQEIEEALTKVYGNSTLYERLDSLIALYESCRDYKGDNHEVKQLQEQSEAFIKIIANTSDAHSAMEQRKSLRELWPTYLPNTTMEHLRPIKAVLNKIESQNVLQKPINPEIDPKRLALIKNRFRDQLNALRNNQLLDVNPGDKKRDELTKVRLLSPLEREEHRVMPAKGLLWQIHQPQNEDAELKIEPFDTSSYTAHAGKKGRAIFILNPQGELFVGNSDVGTFHHSSFQKGGYVAYAGTIEVNQGKLSYLDDYSGHYGPKKQQLVSVLKEFINRGLLSEETKVIKNFGEDSEPNRQLTFFDTEKYLGFKTAKPTAKDIDHFQILSEYMFSSIGEPSDTNESSWRMFAVVMNEYLKDKFNVDDVDNLFNKYMSDIEEIKALMGIDDEYSELNPNEYNEFLSSMRSMIQKDSDLNQNIGGTDWLPEPKQTNELKY